jgi:type VI protein secretion system component Hcp
MAVDAFIFFTANKADQQVKGETIDDFFAKKKAFEIKEFSFDIENPATVGSATGGAGGGKTKFNEFTIKKTTDSASPLFFKNACAGAHYKNAVIAVRKSGAETSSAGAPFLCYEFQWVFATKIEWSGPGDEGPEESITFAYAVLGIKYRRQAADGSLTEDAARIIGWDQRTNAAFGADQLKFDTYPDIT